MKTIVFRLAQIRKIAEQLVEKAKVEIPQMPTYTFNIEHHYVSVMCRKNWKRHVFSLECSPPSTEDDDGLNKMMVSCEICVPSMGLACKRPLMYEQIPTVLEKIGTTETMEQMVIDFDAILEDINELLD